MLSRSHIAILFAFVVPGTASATAHHEQVVVQKIRDPQTNAVNGFRLHAIADPENYDHVRVHVGKMVMDPTLVTSDSDKHRAIATGDTPGYVRATIVDTDKIPLLPAPNVYKYHQLQEIKVDVHYGVNNDLKPGDKADLYTTYSGGTGAAGYWHVYGMHAGPVRQNDTTFVHELPSETSTHPEATETP